MISWRASLVITLPMILALPSLAEAELPLAERQWRAASELERTGQVAQATEIYRSLVDAHPTSDRVDDALLALARLAWPVDSPNELLRTGAKSPAIRSARAYLETLRDQHAAGDVAHEGLWREALLHLVPDELYWRPDQAAALLTTLPHIYPDSPRVPQALALAALLHFDQGRVDAARSLAFRLLVDWPESHAAAHGSIVLALAAYEDSALSDALVALGNAARAADASCRDEAEARHRLATLGDRCGVARLARDYSALIDRAAHTAKRRGSSLTVEDRTAKLPGRVRSIVIELDRSISAAVPREGAVVRISTDGSMTRESREAIETVALDRWGRRWEGAEGVMRAPGWEFSPAERIEVVSIAPIDPGTAWVVDAREKRAIRLDAGSGVAAVAALPERAVALRAVAASVGRAWIMTERPAALHRVAPDGAVELSIGLEELVGEPADFARDRMGHLYVLDRETPAIIVMTATGRFIDRVPLPRGEEGVEKPTALGVAPSGEIAVYDDRTRRITWLR